MRFFKQFRVHILLQKASKQKNLNKAILYYKKILSIDPKILSVYNYIGLCYFELSDFKNAENYFLEAISKFTPDFKSQYEVFYNLAFTYHQMESFELASKYYEKAISKNPDYPFSYKNYAYLLFSEKKYKESLEMFKRYLSFEKDAEVENNIAVIYEEMGKTSEAKRFYLKSIETNPKYVVSYLNLVDLYFEEKNIDEAFNILEKGKSSNPYSSDIFFKLSQLYYEQKDFQKSIEYGEKAIHFGANTVETHKLLEKSRFEIGDIEGAQNERQIIEKLEKQKNR
ncbi:tetratricopeptide repeat protein [bacterium]|nr:tetratricopeptide repeat protein [bacterium]